MFEQLIPVHPKIVHFPIALFIAALGFEVISLIIKKESLHKTAIYLYVAAAFITPLVVLAGLWEQTRLHLSHPVFSQHRLFAFLTLGVSVSSLPILWFIKKTVTKYFRVIFLLFLIAIAGLVTLTGHLGGTMVYEYGAGVAS